MFAIGQVRGGEHLESLYVADCDEVLFSDIRNDGDVGREVEVNWKRDEFVKWKEVFSFDERNMKDEDYCRFLRAVNERSFQLVEIRRLINEVVEFVFGSRILDVVNDCVQNVDTERTWSQLLVESRIDDSFENGDDSTKFIAVGDDLGNGSVHAEEKAGVDFELGDFFPNVVYHPVQLMKMLFMEVDNVSQKISCVLLRFDG